MPTSPPRRRVELRLDVTADDLGDALARIEALCAVVLERESAHMTRARELVIDYPRRRVLARVAA